MEQIIKSERVFETPTHNEYFNRLLEILSNPNSKEQSVALSVWKWNLSHISWSSLIDIITCINISYEHLEEEKEIIKNLCKNLNPETVLWLLDTIQTTYASNPEKDNIQNKLNNLYNQELLNQRMVLWIYLFLIHHWKVITNNTEITASSLSKYTTDWFNTVIAEILFQSEDKKQFRESVFTPLSSKNQENTKIIQWHITNTFWK